MLLFRALKEKENLSDYMRRGIKALHFKMIYHDTKSKVMNEMKLITSAKPLEITNGQTNGQMIWLLQSQGWFPDLQGRNRILWFGLKKKKKEKCKMAKIEIFMGWMESFIKNSLRILSVLICP